MFLKSFYIFALIFAFCCNTGFSQRVNPEEFYAFYKNHSSEFLFAQSTANFDYKIAFKPFQQNLIKFVKDETNLTKKEYKKFKKQNSKNLDFILQISSVKEPFKEFLKFDNGLQSFEQKVSYYSFDFKKDIVLVLDSLDTLKLDYYNFERGFDINPNGEFYLSFNIGKKKFHKAQILIKNRAYNETNIAFTYQQKSLFDIPQLKHYKKW